MTTSKPVRWAKTLAILLAVTILAFIPILLVLVRTPLHDGSDVPSDSVLSAAVIASVGIGVLAARWLHRRAG